MNPIFEFDRLYPYALPPAFTFLVSIFLAALIIQKGDRNKENRLFVFFCLLQALISLEIALNTFIASEHTALAISRFADMFYVFIIPVSVHFIFEAIDFSHGKKMIRWLYVFSFIMSPLTQTQWYFSGIKRFSFGYFTQGGPAFQLFGLVGLGCMVYVIPILYGEASRAPSSEKRIKALFILYGLVANVALTAGNILPILGFNIYPPGNFGFIPLGLIAYGLLQHNLFQTTKGGISKDFIPRLLTIAAWTPLFAAVFFWLISKPGPFYPNIAGRIFPYALPPIFSYISCFVLATFCFMQRTIKSSIILFGLIATLWGYLNIDIAFNMLHTDSNLALQVSRFCHIFLVYQIGLSVHFIYSVIGRKERWALVYPCYALGFFLMLFTQSNWYFQGTYEYYWGFFAKKNILFDLFGAASFAVIIWGIIILYKAIRKETDIDLKKKYFYVLIGVLVTGVFNLFNIPALNGIALYPLGNFTFIPILIMGYGVFRHNILKINVYTRKKILEKTIRAALTAGYISLILIFYWAINKNAGAATPYISFWGGLWGSFDPSHLLGEIYPYGIPPLIAFFCATYFAAVALRLGQNQPEALIFSLLCFLMAFVSFDILMNGIVKDEAIGMQISRLTHLLLVFAPAFCLHLIYIVTRHRNRWWLIYAAYVFALVMMPLTQTGHYIHGMRHYFWGFFAKGALLFDVFALIFVAALGYGAVLLIKAYNQTEPPLLKHRLFYLASGFVLSGAMYMGNVFTLKGYEIYPPGNFVFIPLMLWAYALFKQNLNDVLQITRKILFYLGLFVAASIIAISYKKTFPSIWSAEIYLLGIVISIIILGGVAYVWNNILTLFFGEQKQKLEQILETVHNNLSTSQSMNSIFAILKTTIFHELQCSAYTMLIAEKPKPSAIDGNAKVQTVFSGWESSNPRKNVFSGTAPVIRQDSSVALEAGHPLLPMFGQYFSLTAREQIEEWLLEKDMVLDSKDPLFQAEFILPIYFEDRLSCLILFGDKIDGSLYSRDEKEFLHQFGLSLGPYLENAKLIGEFEKKVEERTYALKKALNETKAKEEEITHINEVIQTINSTLDLNIILSSFEQALQSIFDFNQIGIFLVSDSDNRLFLNNYAGSGVTEDKIQALKNISLPIQPGVSMNCETVLRKTPAFFPNVTLDLIKSATPTDKKAFEINPIQAMLFCPLEFQKKVIGTVVFAHTEKPFHLEESGIDKIQRYVSQIATAVNNARLTDETHKALLDARAKEQEISRMNRIVQIVNSTLDLDKVAVAVSGALKRIFDFDQMSIQLLNESGENLVFIKAYGGRSTDWQLEKLLDKRIPLTETESVFIQPILKRRPVYIRQITPESITLMSPSDREIYQFSRAKAYLFLPIQVHNEIIGTIGFGNTQSFFALGKKDIERIEHFVSQIATAIHNARLYNDLSKARSEAESATKYKSEFLANMSHEIRTPLNAILGLTGLTLNTALTPKQKDYLIKIKDSSNALFRIVNDILDFSKIEAGKLDLENVEFKIDDTMTHLANMFSGQVADKGIEMIFTRSPDIPEILEGDPLRLGQILTNLVSNAFKFTDDGEILIRAELLRKENHQAVLKFTVKDTGIGIDPDRLQMLFDPFTQADGSTTRKYGGTGLGLAICRQLVAMMDGEISAQSVPGAGSAFSFTATFRCPSGKAKKLPAPHPDLRGLKVLVVDDNKTVQLILMEVLASFNFEPTTVSSGEAALAALIEAKKNNPFDLILLDWKLPGMDGIECARQIRKHPDFSGLPIVMMTAFGRDDVKDLADQAGINAYLTKPMTSSMMIDTFMEVFGKITRRKTMADSIREKEIETFNRLKGARLLLVEDNPINQQVAVELLKSAELIIDIANNGKEALEAVARTSYDAVLMDVQMPVMDGYEATRRIRENPQRKSLPIIAMTAHAMISEKQKCLDAGMNDHIPKPIDPKTVFDTLSKWIPSKHRRLPPPSAAVPEKVDKAATGVDLPDQVPGIDIAAGVARVAGNKTIYRDLLMQFYAKYSHIYEEIRLAVSESRLDAAANLAHTVKGISGNMGANTLHRAAGELEKTLTQNLREDAENQMPLFKKALDQVFDAIATLSAADVSKAPATPVHPVSPQDILKSESALSECARLLKSDFVEAMGRLEDLKTILKDTPLSSLILELETAMNAFNIEGAQAAIAIIAKELHALAQ
jgi:signal transduction histidine kinase/CheY-like chemotaxis protein